MMMNKLFKFLSFAWMPLYGGGGKGGGGSSSSIDSRIVDLANEGTFKPFSLTTSAGTGYGTEDGQFGAASSPEFKQAQGSALGGLNQLAPQVADAFGRQPNTFGFNSNIEGATQDIFNQQSALLQPAFAQQNSQMQNQLFGSGRMGLGLTAGAAGAGGEGFVNPDAFGLGRAQSQTLADLAVQSRQQALGEQQQQFGIDSGVFGINEGLQQQYANNLMAGSQGLFGIAGGISAQELALLQGGLQAEQVRGGSYIDAAAALGAGQATEQEGSGGKGFLGSLAQAGATAYASDERLKENIKSVW